MIESAVLRKRVFNTMGQSRNKSWTKLKRDRVKASGVFERYLAAALGEIEISTQEERMSKHLIDKVLPSLSHVAKEYQGRVEILIHPALTNNNENTIEHNQTNLLPDNTNNK